MGTLDQTRWYDIYVSYVRLSLLFCKTSRAMHQHIPIDDRCSTQQMKCTRYGAVFVYVSHLYIMRRQNTMPKRELYPRLHTSFWIRWHYHLIFCMFVSLLYISFVSNNTQIAPNLGLRYIVYDHVHIHQANVKVPHRPLRCKCI